MRTCLGPSLFSLYGTRTFCSLVGLFLSLVTSTGAFAQRLSYTRLDPSGLVKTTIRELYSANTSLDLSVPNRLQLKKFLNIQGPAADKYIVGLLATLMGGAPFLVEWNTPAYSALEQLGAMNLEEAQASGNLEILPGEHARLLEWILAQPDHSVSPDALLAKSIEITNGQVFKALLVGWDILSSGWVGHDLPAGMSRSQFPRTLKLIDIPHVPGDLFPSWYHFWGTMVFGYYQSAMTYGTWIYPEAFSAGVIGIEETLGWPKRRTESMIQRVEINFAGARAGATLFRQLRRYSRDPGAYVAALPSPTPYIIPQTNSLKGYIAEFRKLLRPVSKACANALKKMEAFEIGKGSNEDES